jgi:D-glycero-alpha-D-manno-heptose-7-phosphate kinase
LIITRTPFRISFFGGGTDYPAWYKVNGGQVLGASIDKYCYISVRHLPPFFPHRYRVVYSKIENVEHHNDIQHPAVKAVLEHLNCTQGLEIHHDGDLPARSGLGSSSSFTVGLLNALYALRGEYVSQGGLASEAIHVEQDLIGEHVGSQDQIFAAHGGLNRIRFFPSDGHDIDPIIIRDERKEQLEGHLMLVFTGLSRFSTEIAKTKIDNFHCRHKELHTMGQMVDEAVSLLASKSAPIEEFGKLLHESWQLKRTLSDKVSNSEIDSLYETALKAGAIGGKVTGAGGGGFMLLFAPPERQSGVREALKDLIHVPVKFDNAGTRVVVYQQ